MSSCGATPRDFPQSLGWFHFMSLFGKAPPTGIRFCTCGYMRTEGATCAPSHRNMCPCTPDNCSPTVCVCVGGMTCRAARLPPPPSLHRGQATGRVPAAISTTSPGGRHATSAATLDHRPVTPQRAPAVKRSALWPKADARTVSPTIIHSAFYGSDSRHCSPRESAGESQEADNNRGSRHLDSAAIARNPWCNTEGHT